MTPKNTICLWYESGAEEAAHRAPGDYPDGKEGDALTVEFTVMGIPCIG